MKKNLSPDHRAELLNELKTRFEENMARHEGIEWAEIEAELESSPDKLWSLAEMERTGGEPDCVGIDKVSGQITFFDCSAESPKGRRSICFDRAGWESRKEARPDNTAVDLADEMGVEMLSEEEYRFLQTLGEFDLKTSSWIKTPADVRSFGGALFCDRRFGKVFTYHNGAQSYYAARAFRASLRV